MMRRYRFFFLCNLAAAFELAAQTAVDVPRAEEKQKQQNVVAKEQEKHAQATTTVEFSGEQAFKEKDLRSAVKEQLATVDRYGLTPARADDLAFFVEVFYRKHGYTKVSVHYRIESRDRLRLEINEGSLMTLGTITFEGNSVEPTNKLFEFVVGPTRQRYSKLQRRLPFVAADVQEGVDLAVSPGQLYHFSGEVFVNGLTRLRPSFVQKRFTRLKGQTYSPEALDERFRTLMRTGLFNVLKIEPTPIADEDMLLLNISAEEAKSKEVGFSLGYGTFEGGIIGAQFRDRDLFGYGRPLTLSVEVSQRSYKGEVVYEDPFLFDTDFSFRNRAAAFTFDYDGYSKFEIGDRVELSRKITKQYEAGLVFAARHVEVTQTSIARRFLGETSYFANSLGFFQTLDLRESPLVAPRGLLINTTLDVASTAFGSDIQLIRGTGRIAYFLPFGPKSLTPGVVEDQTLPPLQRWFQQSSLAFGARAGIVHSLNHSGPDEPTTLPIDERFFNGGATTVRSFGERKLGPSDPKGNPIGGEFYTVFNVEYTFPIYGELQGALFFDAGNLLPTSEEPGVDDMRYALGGGLRYKLPIGPIRLDYGWNPDRAPGEDFGAFHFSFGFAF